MIAKQIKIQLNEGEVKQDIQILRAANIYDSRYGKVEITETLLAEMVKNFVNKVRGIDLMIDYGHNTDGEAAGWIKDLYLSEDGKELWAKVEWTKGGQIALEERRYIYISADFEKQYRDNETLINYGAVLKGAALTNRPVVKNMTPAITLGEIKMDEMVKTLMEMMKVEDASQLEEKVKQMMEKELELSAKLAEYEKAKEETVLEEDKKEEEIVSLSEKVKELTTKLELGEKNSKFNVMLAEGKVVEAQRNAFIGGDMIKFAENAGEINLSERGHGKDGDNKISKEDNFESQVIALAESKIKSGECKNIVDAQEAAMKELKK